MFSETLGVARKYGARVGAAGLALASTTAAMAAEGDPSWMTEGIAKAAAIGVAVVAVVGAIALAGMTIWGAKWGARRLGFL